LVSADQMGGGGGDFAGYQNNIVRTKKKIYSVVLYMYIDRWLYSHEKIDVNFDLYSILKNIM